MSCDFAWCLFLQRTVSAPAHTLLCNAAVKGHFQFVKEGQVLNLHGAVRWLDVDPGTGVASSSDLKHIILTPPPSASLSSPGGTVCFERWQAMLTVALTAPCVCRVLSTTTDFDRDFVCSVRVALCVVVLLFRSVQAVSAVQVGIGVHPIDSHWR